jgi:hypothetical protein
MQDQDTAQGFAIGHFDSRQIPKLAQNWSSVAIPGVLSQFHRFRLIFPIFACSHSTLSFDCTFQAILLLARYVYKFDSGPILLFYFRICLFNFSILVYGFHIRFYLSHYRLGGMARFVVREEPRLFVSQDGAKIGISG